ncbi:hypothetical protein MesoLj113b_70330 (plasmid) [Mesorhizobium sp. 113-3-3]|nr:hypothetical protein MesoLj113b_70330 [Mesorhizobium sp. 113-3-3]
MASIVPHIDPEKKLGRACRAGVPPRARVDDTNVLWGGKLPHPPTSRSALSMIWRTLDVDKSCSCARSAKRLPFRKPSTKATFLSTVGVNPQQARSFSSIIPFVHPVVRAPANP